LLYLMNEVSHKEHQYDVCGKLCRYKRCCVEKSEGRKSLVMCDAAIQLAVLRPRCGRRPVKGTVPEFTDTGPFKRKRGEDESDLDPFVVGFIIRSMKNETRPTRRQRRTSSQIRSS